MSAIERYEEVVAHHHYSLGQITLLLSMVLTACTSVRCACRVLAMLRDDLPLPEMPDGVPSRSTLRLWLLRLGHYELTRPKQEAEDWVWIIDHTNQVGVEKCLVILGIRLCDLPPPGQCLQHQDMQLIDLVPVRHSDKQVVFEQLESAALKTGVPRAILDDHGGDLAGGAAMFLQQHPETAEIYDITHKGACLLKRRLEKDPQWLEFCRQVGQTKFQIQQTELAFLVPPSQRSKARYMNLGQLIGWAERTLAVLEQQPREVLKYVTSRRLEEKLGWLRSFADPLRQWSLWLALLHSAEDHVRAQGLSKRTPVEVAKRLDPLATTASSRELRDELVAFITDQCADIAEGERLPGSTEVLESCFGKFKSLERDQQKGGFTGLLLAIGAIVSTRTVETIGQALQSSTTQAVWDWCRNVLGMTIQTKRQEAYQAVEV